MSPTDRNKLARSARTTDSIVPCIGSMSGATIMAPITVAVESPTTPAAAMIEARINRTQKRLMRFEMSGPSNKTESRIRTISSAARVGMALTSAVEEDEGGGGGGGREKERNNRGGGEGGGETGGGRAERGRGAGPERGGVR